MWEVIFHEPPRTKHAENSRQPQKGQFTLKRAQNRHRGSESTETKLGRHAKHFFITLGRQRMVKKLEHKSKELKARNLGESPHRAHLGPVLARPARIFTKTIDPTIKAFKLAFQRRLTRPVPIHTPPYTSPERTYRCFKQSICHCSQTVYMIFYSIGGGVQRKKKKKIYFFCGCCLSLSE